MFDAPVITLVHLYKAIASINTYMIVTYTANVIITEGHDWRKHALFAFRGIRDEDNPTIFLPVSIICTVLVLNTVK